MKFSDQAKSGKSIAGRKGFEDLIKKATQLAQSGDCDGIIVEDWKRWGRNLNESLRFKLDMDDIGVPIYTIGSNHTLVQLLEMYTAQSDNEERAKNVRENMALWVEKGWHLGPAPFGYTRIPITKTETGEKTGGKLVYHSKEGKAIEEVFRLWDSGMGTRVIANEMNILGYKTRTGMSFKPSVVHDIIKNPIYTGHITRNRTTTDKNGQKTRLPIEDWVWSPVCHHQFITKEQWQYNQRRINANNPFEKHSNTSKYLLAGKILCDYCGKGYMHHKTQQRTRDYYTCSTVITQRRKYCPHSPHLPSTVLEDWVLHTIAQGVLSKQHIENAIQQQQDTTQKNALLKTLNASLSETQKSINNIITSIANLGGSEALEFALKQKEATKQEIEERIHKLSQEKQLPKREVISLADEYIKMLKRGGIGRQRQVLDELSVQLHINKDTVAMHAWGVWWEPSEDKMVMATTDTALICKRKKYEKRAQV